MLLEHINHCNNLPFAVSFCNTAEEDIHCHKEMEIALILRGSTNCKIHHSNYTLKSGDIIIADTEDLHRFYGASDDILMLVLHLDLGYFADLYPNIDYMIFACENCTRETASKYQELQNKTAFLKHYMAKIMFTYLNDENDDLLMEHVNDFIFILVNQFQGFFIEDTQFKTGRSDLNDEDLKRLYRIIKYIFSNYDKKITLEDLAELEHLSPYYISHIIKDTTGLNFQNLLNYTRVEFAEKLLAEGKHSLTQISQLCGFSSPAYFNKCFKAWHTVTPAEYKKQLVRCDRRTAGAFSQDEALSLLSPYLKTYERDSKKRTLSNIPHHIFIPVNYNSHIGRDFKNAFSLRISLRSTEDVFHLHRFRNHLSRLEPDLFLLDQNIKNSIQDTKTVEQMIADMGFAACLVSYSQQEVAATANLDGQNGQNLSWDLSSPAQAFALLQNKKHIPIPLIGEEYALFTPEGLCTPFYYLYSLFAKIEGVITEQREQYTLVKNKNKIHLIISHYGQDHSLKAHIHLTNAPRGGLITETLLSKETSCQKSLSLIEPEKELSRDLIEHINRVSAGISSLQALSAEDMPDFYVAVDADSLAYCEIHF